MRWLVWLSLLRNASAVTCDLSSNNVIDQMCTMCASDSECRRLYSLQSGCAGSTFSTMFDLFKNKSDSSIYEVTDASCDHLAMIAMNAAEKHGNLCGGNRVPKLNARQTSTFCVCTDGVCSDKFTTHMLDALVITLILILLGLLFMNGFHIINSNSNSNSNSNNNNNSNSNEKTSTSLKWRYKRAPTTDNI